MKSRKILLGSLSAVLVAVALVFALGTTETGVYQARELNSNNNAEGYRGAFEYYNMIRKNNVTGEFDAEAYDRAKAEALAMAENGDRVQMDFVDQGPDNVGGRTRAILVDKDDDNLIYAGGVSGGLFFTTNRGSTWKKVEGYDGNLAISAMCQTDNGHIYVATGHEEENFTGGTGSGMNGDGVYVSTDNAATFTQIPGTETNAWINKMVTIGNKVIIAGQDGLKVYENGTLDFFTDLTSPSAMVAISPDKQVIVASFLSGTHATYVSTDGGATFDNKTGSENNGLIPGSNIGRMEYAISHEKLNGNYYIYASQSSPSGVLRGVFYSADHGDSWARLAPANDGSPGAFEPFGANQQGNYDQILTVVPGDPESILFGGIDVWAKSINDNWDLRSQWFLPKLNPLYVHADQHEMVWDSQGRLWLGTDGGVAYSDDNGNTFRESNRGYNITQFYGISTSAHGDVMGGAQDNGTQVNYHNNHTYREHDRFSGGDGFTCAMSFINRDIGFSTLYFGLMFRSGDRGANTVNYIPSNLDGCTPGDLTGGDACGTFYTSLELYENPNDTESEDTIVFTPTANLTAGTEILVPSLTSQQTIPYTLTEDIRFQDTLLANPLLTETDTIVVDTTAGSNSINLSDFNWSIITGSMPLSIGDVILVGTDTIVLANVTTINHFYGTNPGEPGEVVDMEQEDMVFGITWDTVRVVDVYQSWVALGLGNGDGLWLSRNGLRLSALHDGFIQAGGGIVGGVTDLEFSKDGNHLYVGTSGGRLYRLSGLSDIYSPDATVEDNGLTWNHPNTTTTFDLINSFGGPVLGINVNRANEDLVFVSIGGFGGTAKVQKSLNATGPSPSFTSITGNLPDMPVLSIVADRDDPNIILAGTEFGLYATEDGGGNWSYVESPFGRTPIFDLMQNWRTWNEGNHWPGQIVVGTHGRGIWTSNAYLSTPEVEDNVMVADAISNLSIFPNPVIADANITFDVKEAGKGALRVYNLRGQLVIDMQDVSLNAGKNILPVGMAELSEGAYIVSLTAGNEVKTTKFIKQ